MMASIFGFRFIGQSGWWLLIGGRHPLLSILATNHQKPITSSRPAPPLVQPLRRQIRYACEPIFLQTADPGATELPAIAPIPVKPGTCKPKPVATEHSAASASGESADLQVKDVAADNQSSG